MRYLDRTLAPSSATDDSEIRLKELNTLVCTPANLMVWSILLRSCGCFKSW